METTYAASLLTDAKYHQELHNKLKQPCTNLLLK